MREGRNRFEILCLHDLSWILVMATNHVTYLVTINSLTFRYGVPTFDGKGRNNKMNKVKKTYTSITIKHNIHTHTQYVTFLRYRQNTSSICLNCYRDITHIYIFFWQDFVFE